MNMIFQWIGLIILLICTFLLLRLLIWEWGGMKNNYLYFKKTGVFDLALQHDEMETQSEVKWWFR